PTGPVDPTGPTGPSGMTAHLSAADLGRMSRAGVRALSSDEGLALFDAALARPETALIPARFDVAGLRSRADVLPPAMRGLLRDRAMRSAATHIAAGSLLQQRLRALGPADRARALLDLVCTEVATVLGITTPGTLPTDRPLRELGLDS